jgi:hypothetical protein
MARPPSVHRSVARRIAAGRAAGRLGPEHEPEIAIALLLAKTLADHETPANTLAPIARELTTHLRGLGLTPTVSAPGELEQLLGELRG